MFQNLITISFILWCYGLQAQSKVLPPFSAVSTAGSVQVELIKGNEEKAEYNILKGSPEDLYMEVEQGTLIVKIKSKNSWWNRSETKAKVKVFYRSLDGIESAAGSSVKSDDVMNTTSLSVEASSGSNCNLNLDGNKVKLYSSSGAKILVKGKCKWLTLEASSGSRIDAADFPVAEAEAEVSSGASIAVNASKKLKADASSGGSIKYKGKPESTNFDSGMSGGSIKSF